MARPTLRTRITLSQAIEGYNLAAKARRLSEYTRADYNNTFRKFQAFLGNDPLLADICSDQVKEFLAAQTGVSDKTLLNYHTGLAALWTWAVRETLAGEQIVHKVEPPEPEQRVIVPFTEQDIKMLLGAVGNTRPYSRPGKVTCVNARPTADRDRTIILLLLDTGLRASELFGMLLPSLDLRNRQVKLFGKGKKERLVPFCARTGQAIWRYLAPRNGTGAQHHGYDALLSRPGPGQWANREDLLLARFARGFSYVIGWPGLLGVILLAMLLNFLLSPGSSLLPLLVLQEFKGGAAELGWVQSALGVGVILTGLAPASMFWLLLAANFILGMMQVMTNGPLGAIIQSTIEPDYQGRVFSLINVGATAMMPLGLLVAGPLSDWLGVRFWYMAGGALCILATLAASTIPAIMNIEQNKRTAADPANAENLPPAE